MCIFFINDFVNLEKLKRDNGGDSDAAELIKTGDLRRTKVGFC